MAKNLDPKSFRALMSGWITGIALVTTKDEKTGRNIGIVCNSLTSVSLDPLLISWCVDKKTKSFPDWENAKEWNVHILAAGQEDLVHRFTAPVADRFAGLDISYTDSGIPILPNVETYFTCKTFSKNESGDHVILVVEVIDYQDSIAQPLTFFRGKFLPGPHA
jgi:3-hydroxy-9,10-secoandrosta-1,3,5(10)-triene-9,17-dione monooxygenase reductase component